MFRTFVKLDDPFMSAFAMIHIFRTDGKIGSLTIMLGTSFTYCLFCIFDDHFFAKSINVLSRSTDDFDSYRIRIEAFYNIAGIISP